MRRPDAFEHDYMMRALRPEFAERGLQIEEICWDETGTDWTSYDAAIIGTTWDYWDHQARFLETLQQIGQQIPLYNSESLVRWNSHKSYLLDLEAAGARLIPTLWLDHVSDKSCANAFRQLGSDKLVFKRQVGAGADGQHLLSIDQTRPEMRHPMMVQPFLPAIQTEGELSFIFIDGEFCHALIKQARPGDYRIQSSYGGQETAIEPSKADLNAARHILQMTDEKPLYARVDMVRHEDGGLLLMELELIEPYLYPEQGFLLGKRMAQAVSDRLRALG